MMKKLVAIIAVAAIAASATMAFAGMQARSGVNGSFHDMNAYAPTKGGTPEKYERVCVYCHTPHNAVVNDPSDPLGVSFLPLWNHDFSPLTYNTYQWATPDNLPLTVTDPLVGPSRLCMSCHDGVTAVDQHGPAMPAAGTVLLSGDRAIGRNNGDLTDDHPIGFSYIDALARNIGPGGTTLEEVVDPSEAFATAIAISADNSYNLVTRGGTRTIQSTLYNSSIMTCASCHEVHNKENATQAPVADGSGDPTPNYFLYAKEQYSLICLSCHIK